MIRTQGFPYRAHFLHARLLLYAALWAMGLCLALGAAMPGSALATPAPLPCGGPADSPDAGRLGLTGILEISPRLDILEDGSKVLGILDVAGRDMESRFTPLGEPYRAVTPRAADIWLRLRLTPEDVQGENGVQSRDWVLVFANIYVDQLSFFLPNPEHPGQWVVKEASRFGPHPHGHLAIPFTLGPELLTQAVQGEPLTMFIRVKHHLFHLPGIFLFESQAYYNSLVVWYTLLGIFYGVMLVMIPLSLLLFVFTKDRSMLWYSLLLLALTAFFLFDNDFLDRALKNWGQWELNQLVSVIIAAVVVLAVQFTRSFLMIRRIAPGLDRVSRLYSLFGYALAFVPLARHEGLLHFWLNGLGLSAPVMMIGSAIWCRLKGFKPARFFLMAVSIFPLGIFVFIITDIGFLPRNVLTLNAFQIGSMLMAGSMSLALLDRIRELRKERERLEEARKAAVAALEERDRRVRAIFDQSFQFMSLLDPEGRVLEINRSVLAHHELTRKDIVGRPLWEVDPNMTPENRKLFRNALVQAGQGEFTRFELAEHGMHFDISVKPVFGEGGKTEFIIAEGRDITELARVQQQMFHADKMAALGRIMAGVAHEINNPNNFIYFNLPVLRDYLRAIRAELTECLRDRPDARILNMEPEALLDDVFQLLEDMEHGSRRITGIVDELKNYIRGHDEDEEMRPESLATVAGHVMALVGKQVRKSVGRLDVDVPEDLPRVIMHAGKVEQVLINLLINAAQALERTPRAEAAISLRARADGTGLLRVEVEDNGPGIPQEIQDSVFEPFFTTKGKQHGTGLGLAISQRIMEEHGGAIAMESRPGRTIFRLALPTAKESK